jgi:hypothetical protein
MGRKVKKWQKQSVLRFMFLVPAVWLSATVSYRCHAYGLLQGGVSKVSDVFNVLIPATAPYLCKLEQLVQSNPTS